MSQKTVAQLHTEIATQIPTNGANLITAADVRGVLDNMVDSSGNILDHTSEAGPTSSTTDNIASFNGTDGRTIKDSGVLATSVVVGPASATDNAITRFDGTTGKLVQNSAATIADTTGNISAGTYNGNTIGSGSTSGTNTGDNTLGAGVATFLATPSSANLKSAVTDETGSGALVFADTPTFVTPLLGTPTSGVLTNCTGLPCSSLTVGDFNSLAIYGYLGTVKTDTSTSYATINSDTGKIVELNNGSAIGVTLHKAAPVGHNCIFVQMGAGQVTFAAESGGSMRAYLSLTKTAGQYAAVSAYVRTNSGGSAAEWVLSGTMV